MIACKNIHSESEVRLDTLQDGNLLIKTCASSTPKTTACTVINKSRIHTNHNKIWCQESSPMEGSQNDHFQEGENPVKSGENVPNFP